MLLEAWRLVDINAVELMAVSLVKLLVVTMMLIFVVAELLVVTTLKTADKLCGESMLTMSGEVSATTEPSSIQCMKTWLGLDTVAIARTDLPASYQSSVDDGTRVTVPASEGVESTRKRNCVA